MSDHTRIDKCIQVNFKECLPLQNQKFSNGDNSQPKNRNDQNIITREEAEYLSSLSIFTEVQLIDYQLVPYSEEKIGFLGSHQKLILESRKPGCHVSIKNSYFVKAMPYDVPLQAAYALEKNAFTKEVEFFREIEPLMGQGYKGEPWTPKCFLAKEDSLVLEDMKLLGYTNRPRILNEDNLMSAVACIARFHASSLLAEERLNGNYPFFI